MNQERKTVFISLTLLLIGLLGFVHAMLFAGSNGTVLDLVFNNLALSEESASQTTQEIFGAILAQKESVIQRIDKRFLSFGIDTAQLLGESWWQEGKKDIAKRQAFNLQRPALDLLVKGLSPAYFRVGGTAADELKIDRLKKSTWDSLYSFTRRNNLDLVFTLGAGHQARNQAGQLDTQALQEFFAYTKQSGQSPMVWEFGNELNAYWVLSGLDKQISPERYADDLRKVSKLLKSSQTPGLLASQGSAFWPLIGEPLSFFYGYTPQVLQRAGDIVDIVTWHYYPQQSFRSPVATVRANPYRLLQPARLDEVAHWATKMRTWRDAWAPGKQLWLGETGNAQSGGEPGVSDRFVSSLWWLDQLGLMAANGMSVLVRHTLAGGDYGLIDEESLVPRPDYWASFLWKQVMETEVLSPTFVLAQKQGASADDLSQLRAYMHKSRHEHPNSTASEGQVSTQFSLLLINISQNKRYVLNLPRANQSSDLSIWVGSAPSLSSPLAFINGQTPAISGNHLAPITPIISTKSTLRVEPLSYVFVVWRE